MTTTLKSSGVIPADMIHNALTGNRPSITLSRMFGITQKPADIMSGNCDTCGHGCYLVPGEPAMCVECAENMAMTA